MAGALLGRETGYVSIFWQPLLMGRITERTNLQGRHRVSNTVNENAVTSPQSERTNERLSLSKVGSHLLDLVVYAICRWPLLAIGKWVIQHFFELYCNRIYSLGAYIECSKDRA